MSTPLSRKYPERRDSSRLYLQRRKRESPEGGRTRWRRRSQVRSTTNSLSTFYTGTELTRRTFRTRVVRDSLSRSKKTYSFSLILLDLSRLTVGESFYTSTTQNHFFSSSRLSYEMSCIFGGSGYGERERPGRGSGDFDRHCLRESVSGSAALRVLDWPPSSEGRGPSRGPSRAV